MTFQQLELICFAAGSLIHGTQLVLIARLTRTSGAGLLGLFRELAPTIVVFLWQFGNLVAASVAAAGVRRTSALYQVAFALPFAAAVCFPVTFSYFCDYSSSDPPAARLLNRLGKSLHYPLWIWTAGVMGMIAAQLTVYPKLSRHLNLMGLATSFLMLFYFTIFTSAGIVKHRATHGETAPTRRASRASIAAAGLAVGLMGVALAVQYWRGPVIPYLGLAAKMTSVPFSIALAYWMYQLPFMDLFLREVWATLILLAAFGGASSLETFLLPPVVLPLSLASTVIVLAYSKGPVTRWVERRLMGYKESIDHQEERVGQAIRARVHLHELDAQVSELLRAELDAEWIKISSTPDSNATHRFQIPGSPPLTLSIGPRVGGRQYMSRELRLIRTAVLEFAARRHELWQEELRSVTTRAQIRVLQAQINPHFLFNTLNVLAALVHTSPGKAERLTEELAEVFRYALESTRQEWVDLGAELNFLEAYLEIEKARFEERLKYRFEVEPSVRSVKIPPMILQPIVENAVKHGIGPKVEGGEVRILGRQAENGVMLVVEDTGVGRVPPISHGRNGIGLANVRERMRHLYGEAASLELEDMNPVGTRVVLRIPHSAGSGL